MMMIVCMHDVCPTLLKPLMHLGPHDFIVSLHTASTCFSITYLLAFCQRVYEKMNQDFQEQLSLHSTSEQIDPASALLLQLNSSF